MTRDDLLTALAATLQKTKVQQLTALAGEDKFSVQDLFEITFLKEKPAVAFRAAWVLEHIEEKYPQCFLPIFPEFIRWLPKQSNLSCQRHFTKILMHFTSPKANPDYKAALANLPDREPIVEVVFEWLIQPETPVAVKVNCLEILLNLSKEFSWIKEELQAQTEFFLRDGSAAMQSRGRKILQMMQG